MRYLYARSLFPVCWWFILTLWIFRNSDKEGAGLKKIMYLHSTDAVLGLWILHVLLGCSERWLETALMQCHTAVQCQFYGRWAVSRALLTIMSGVNTACCMLSDISTSCCCPNSCCWFWSMWDLCVKWKGCVLSELSEQPGWDLVETSHLRSLLPLLMARGGVVLLFTHTGILLMVLGVTA